MAFNPPPGAIGSKPGGGYIMQPAPKPISNPSKPAETKKSYDYYFPGKNIPAPTPLKKGGGGKGGGGGGSKQGSGISATTPSNQLVPPDANNRTGKIQGRDQEITDALNSRGQSQQFNFTGKVESYQGDLPTGTDYFYGGKKVGSIGSGGSSLAGESPVTFEFGSIGDSKFEKVALTSGGAMIDTYYSEKVDPISAKSFIDLPEGAIGSKPGGGFIYDTSVKGLQINEGTPKGQYTQLGRFIVSPNEEASLKASGEMKPFYAPISTNIVDIATESNIINTYFPVYSGGGLGTSKGQFELSAINKKGVSELIAFEKNPEAFIGKGGVATTSSEGGTNIDATNYFNDRYFSAGARIQYGREQFQALPTTSRFLGATREVAYTGGQLGIGLIELGGTVGKTIIANTNPQFEKGTSPKFFNVQNFEVSSPIKNVPGSQSLYETGSFLGLEYPKNLKNVPGYLKELPYRPGAVTSQSAFVVSTASIAGLGVKTFQTGKAIYAEELAATGSRSSAINLVAGEAISNLSPIQIRQRIFLAPETGLTPFKTTQVNKGATLTTTKVGKLGDNSLYTQSGLPETARYYTPTKQDYLIYKPYASGAELTKGTLDLSKFQQVSLRENVFVSGKQTDIGTFKVIGKGGRDVFSVGSEPVQLGRYSIGTRVVAEKSVQSFSSTGYGKLVETPSGKNLVIDFGKSTFKPLETTTYYGGYGKVLPSIVQEGKAFTGSGISGRPSTGKSGGFSFETGRLDTEAGTTIFGKSYSKYASGGRRGVLYFNTKTLLPKSEGISLESAGGTPKTLGYPKGISVQNVYRSGEFDYLKLQSKAEGAATQSALSSKPSKSFGGLKGTNQFNIIEGSLKTENIARGGLKVDLATTPSQKLSGTQRYSLLGDLGIGTTTKTDTKLFEGVTTTITPISRTTTNIIPITETTLFTPSIITPRTPRTGSPFVNTTFGFPGFGLPVIPAFPEYTPGGRRQGKQKKRRTSSIVSAELGIYDFAPSNLEFTGIVSRPILTTRRRKR